MDLPESLQVRFSQLIREQTRGSNYDLGAFLEYIGKALSSMEMSAPEKKALLHECLLRIMPSGEAAQLASLLIILYNQVRPAAIDLEVNSAGWLVCPFGPHILPAATMKKHLNLNHFAQMKGYSYENGRLIPIEAASTSTSSTTTTTMSSFASSEPAVAAAQQQQQQGTTQWQAGYVPTSQVMASLAARNQGGLQQQQQQQQQQGMGRGRGTTFVPGNPPF